MSVRDVVAHLVVYGPARNDAEREELLAQLDGEDKPKGKPSKEGTPKP